MGVAREISVVPLPPDRAFALWVDVRRWASFVDGFTHAVRVDDSWPAEGAKLVWRTGPAGRGVVTERVVASEPAERFATQVYEERLEGEQTIRFAPADEGCRVELELDYRLSSGGPLAPITDFLFIRRAQTDSIRRTLRRFRTEAAEDAAL